MRLKDHLNYFCDNTIAVLYSNNNRSSSKSKYIDNKVLVVKERAQSGLISIEYMDTNSIIADLLTKILTPKVFIEHTTHMGVILLYDYLLKSTALCVMTLEFGLFSYIVF